MISVTVSTTALSSTAGRKLVKYLRYSSGKGEMVSPSSTSSARPRQSSMPASVTMKGGMRT